MKTKVIEIHGNESEILSIKPKDILNCIPNGNTCGWSILWLEGMGHKTGESVLDIEKSIKSSRDGMLCEWEDLKKLLNEFDQVTELILIGDRERSNLKRYSNDEEMYSNCCYTIELLDSSYWIIHTNNEVSVNLMKKNLAGVKEL